MLVPFVYSTNDFTLDVPGHTWVFHKYAYFAYQNNFPIIASDIYFKDYENSLSDYFYNNFMFKKAPDTYLEKMQKYAIKNLEIQKK